MVVRDAPDRSVVELQLVDAGNNDQLLAIATVTLQRHWSCRQPKVSSRAFSTMIRC